MYGSIIILKHIIVFWEMTCVYGLNKVINLFNIFLGINISFYFYNNIGGRLQLTEDSANYIRYCASRSKINNYRQQLLKVPTPSQVI
jgi:hypothetical protein